MLRQRARTQPTKECDGSRDPKPTPRACAKRCIIHREKRVDGNAATTCSHAPFSWRHKREALLPFAPLMRLLGGGWMG